MPDVPETIQQAAAALADGRTTSVELTAAVIERIADLDPQLNAFIAVTGAAAMAAAERADHDRARGSLRGLLHGIPWAVKDIIDVAGLPTTAHSRVMPSTPAGTSATVVQRMEAAGAVLVGKLALHEFAIGGPTFELPYPPARNPWDLSLHPGGSSSGSAVAVAAGMAFASIGTDTGGSVRNPATCCGIVGLKPTYGVVSRTGVFPLSFSLDHVGPLARTVDDCAVVFAAIAESYPGDPSDVMAQEAEAGGSAGPLDGLSIGIVRHFHEEAGGAAAALIAGLEEAVELLASLGAEVRPCTLPPLAEFAACGRVIQQAESYVVHRDWLAERPEDYSPASLKRLMPGAFLPASDYVAAQQKRRELCSRYAASLDGFDAVVALSGFELPTRLDDPVATAATYERHARMPFNVTGAPVLAVPVGWTDSGLPRGIQIAGRPFAEPVLFRIARALERAVADRHGRRTPRLDQR